MKTMLFGLFVFVLIFNPTTVYGPPPPSYQGGYDYSEWVLIGNITSVEILSDPSSDDFSSRAGFALYTLDVEKYLKNPIENSTITVLGHYQIEKTNVRYSWPPLYEIDQRVLFYIQELQNVPGYDYIIRDRISGVIIEQLCPENTTYENGLCFYDDNPYETNPPCINRTMDDCKERRVSFEPNPYCGSGTELVDGVCQVIKAIQVKTIGDDAPFFGIFVYIDNLFSWIMGK